MSTTYRIIKRHFNEEVPMTIVKEGLSLEEAQEHCKDPETSSSTCKNPENVEYTKKYGPWFDCYEEE